MHKVDFVMTLDSEALKGPWYVGLLLVNIH
jgi:hypothetical protein